MLSGQPYNFLSSMSTGIFVYVSRIAHSALVCYLDVATLCLSIDDMYIACLLSYPAINFPCFTLYNLVTANTRAKLAYILISSDIYVSAMFVMGDSTTLTILLVCVH